MSLALFRADRSNAKMTIQPKRTPGIAASYSVNKLMVNVTQARPAVRQNREASLVGEF
jgi:hypothetical protein